MTVQNFVKIVWTVFEKFDIFMKRSGEKKQNQSRICGKGDGLGFFSSDSPQSQSLQFIGIAHIGPYYGVENDCKNFPSNRMNSFSKSQKKSKNGCVLI